MTAVPYRQTLPSDPNGYEQGRLPQLRHRKVSSAPAVWQPFTVYFIKAPFETVAAQYITDAYGVPTRVGDGLFVAWQALPGNSTKSYSDFLTLLLAGGGVTAVPQTYTHIQTGAALTWTFTHNLGFEPTISILVGGVLTLAEIDHLSINSVKITFTEPSAGTARCT